jgi:hypothetical protein
LFVLLLSAVVVGGGRGEQERSGSGRAAEQAGSAEQTLLADRRRFALPPLGGGWVAVVGLGVRVFLGGFFGMVVVGGWAWRSNSDLAPPSLPATCFCCLLLLLASACFCCSDAA